MHPIFCRSLAENVARVVAVLLHVGNALGVSALEQRRISRKNPQRTRALLDVCRVGFCFPRRNGGKILLRVGKCALPVDIRLCPVDDDVLCAALKRLVAERTGERVVFCINVQQQILPLLQIHAQANQQFGVFCQLFLKGQHVFLLSARISKAQSLRFPVLRFSAAPPPARRSARVRPS